MNVFENATRYAFRFQSVRGLLTTENLWDMPLLAKTGFDLNSVAKTVNEELKAMTEENFVNVASDVNRTSAEERLEIVKHIIKVRMDENTARVNAATRKAEIQKLEGVLVKKQDSAMEELSTEAITARLAELRGN